MVRSLACIFEKKRSPQRVTANRFMYSLDIIPHVIAFVKRIFEEFSEKILTLYLFCDIINTLPKTIGFCKSYRGNYMTIKKPMLEQHRSFLVFTAYTVSDPVTVETIP